MAFKINQPGTPYQSCLDDQRLFVTSSGDGGDSLANAASYTLANAFVSAKLKVIPSFPLSSLPLPWRQSMALYQGSPGVWRRHPDATQWYSNPATTSRDQTLPAMLAMAFNRDYANLWKTQWRILVRTLPVFPWVPLLWAQNTYNNGVPVVGPKVADTFLGHVHVMIRCWGWWALPLYPLLLAWDLLLVISAIMNALPWKMMDGGAIVKKDPNDCDDRNGINSHIAALWALPTPLSWLARKIYSKFRTPTNGSLIAYNGQGPEKLPAMGALVWYFKNDDAIIAEAYRPIIERWFT